MQKSAQTSEVLGSPSTEDVGPPCAPGEQLYSFSSQSSQAMESSAEAHTSQAMESSADADGNEEARSPLISINNSGGFEEGQGESKGDVLESWRAVNYMWSPRSRAAGVSRKWCGRPSHRPSYFRKDIEEEQEYFQQTSGWTDEKHSSYLDSMEADFMKSIMYAGDNKQATDPSIAESPDLVDCASSQQAASAQFKAWRNGVWRPVSLPAPYIGPLIPFAAALKNPWIKHFRPRRKKSPSLMQDPANSHRHRHHLGNAEPLVAEGACKRSKTHGQSLDRHRDDSHAHKH